MGSARDDARRTPSPRSTTSGPAPTSGCSRRTSRRASHGAITAAAGEQVYERLVEDWWAARQQGRDGLMLAPTLADVEQLNALARARLTAAGRVHGPTLTIAAGRQLQAGDHVAFARNDRRLGVLNGTTGIVRAADPTARQVAVRTDDGRDVTVPAAYLDAGDLRHAYATTVHKAQGVTVDNTWALLRDAAYRELGYVALSRHRDGLHTYIPDSPPLADDDTAHPAALDAPDLAPHDALARWLQPSHAQHAAVHHGAPAPPLPPPPRAPRHRDLPDDDLCLSL